MKINVLSYLEASAARVPDRVCWADAASALTYREAWTAVCEMGAALSVRLSTVNAPVCVLLRHDVTDLLAFFSIVYSGNFYVPIDPALPAVRLRSMLETLKPAAIMTAGASIDAELTQDIPVISQQELHTEAPAAAPWKQRKDTDLLYVIFTSGSTGEPKGVSICHRSVIDMVEQFMRAFDFADGAVWGNQAPFDFDVSVKDIFLSLRVGGRLEILEKKLFSFPKLLLERLNELPESASSYLCPATLSPALFERYPDAEALAEADVEDISEYIKRIGMYRTKAKNIVAMAQKLCAEFGGQVPDNYEDLISLPGVGRKTANVVLSVGFGQQRIAVDTHVFRVANRIGLVHEKDVLKTELALMEQIPEERWSRTHHSLIFHGRQCCDARKPKCDSCPIVSYCEYVNQAAKK